jgi:hypothetical protein
LKGLKGKIPEVESEEISFETKKIPQISKGEIPKDFKFKDYSKRPYGYTPKDWAEERSTWRKENFPIFEKNRDRVSSTDDDMLATKKLVQLNKSKKLPEGMSRFLINPETGDFYGLAQIAGQASPEVQQWSKLIARFQNRAKDTFGSRVTNFDLQSYMKQFPGLLNTEEGRTRILDMMKINYELDSLYDKALQKIYDHYGLSGIPPEEADNLSRSLIQEKTEKLKDKYLKLDEENQSSEISNLSGKIIEVIGPDGQEYEIDQSEVDKLPQGFRLK